MKILVNAVSARQGGIATYTRNLMMSFRDRGIDATFAVDCDFPKIQGVRILPFSRHRSTWRRLLWENVVWRSIVSREKPDVLFSSANFALLGCPVPQLLLMREGGLFDPFYLTSLAPELGVKAALIRSARRWLMRFSQRAAERIMTPTSATRDIIVQWEPNTAPKYRVNHYGTLSNIFAPQDASIRGWRSDGVLRLLYVSVYYPHKNPGLVAEVVRALQNQGIPAHATVTMSLDELRKMSASAADVYSLESAVEEGLITLGRVDYTSLPSLYRSHDVFLFPSINETFGHPMIEALSSAIPMVAADTLINREIGGDAALYCRPFSAQSACEQVMALDANPALRHDLGIQGRKRVTEMFDWEAHVDRLIAILAETAAHRRTSS